MAGVDVPAAGAAGAGAEEAPAGLCVEVAGADADAAALAGVLAVITAVDAVASTSTTLIAITRRSPDWLPGKSGRRIPMPMETISAHTTSTPPAM